MPAGTNDHRIVPQLDLPALLIDLHAAGRDFLHGRFQQHVYPAVALCLFELFAVFLLDAPERLAAIGERHPGAGLAGTGERRLECGVAAAHHEHVLIAVLLGID